MILSAFIFYSLLAFVAATAQASPSHSLIRKHPAPREDTNEVQGKSPPGRCVDRCISVYGYAIKALITEPPQRPTAGRPYGFDSEKLCQNDGFMEDGPHCIDCLFRTKNEVDWRSTLLDAFLICVYEFDALACPHSCEPVDKMVAECKRIDNGEIEDPDPVDHTLDRRTPPCVCRPKNRQAVLKCYHCMLNWNAVLAQNWIRYIDRCNDWNDFPFLN